MSDINMVVLIGHLAADPELRYTPQGGVPVASFAVAINRKFKSGEEQKEQVSFIEVVAWRHLAELSAQFLKKGRKVAVQGRLEQQRWTDKDEKPRSKVKVIAEQIQFLGSKGDGQETAAIGAEGSSEEAPAQEPSADDSNGA